MPDIDEILEFKGYDFHSFMSKCRLRVWIYGRMTLSALVMMSDVPDGGLSITNGSEKIATKVMETIIRPKFGMTPDRVTWIEHYEHDGEEARDPIRRPYYDTVTYDWLQPNGHSFKAISPSWQRVSRKWIEELIKETIDG